MCCSWKVSKYFVTWLILPINFFFFVESENKEFSFITITVCHLLPSVSSFRESTHAALLLLTRSPSDCTCHQSNIPLQSGHLTCRNSCLGLCLILAAATVRTVHCWPYSAPSPSQHRPVGSGAEVDSSLQHLTEKHVYSERWDSSLNVKRKPFPIMRY